MADKKNDGLYEGGIGWAIMLVIFAVIIYVIWFYQATNIRDAIRWFKYYEMWLIGWFVGDDFKVLYRGVEVPWQDGYDTIAQFRRDALTFDHLSYFTALTMQPLKWIYTAILGVLGFWALLYGPGTRYRQKLGLEGLIGRQAGNFPVIAPFVKFNPQKQPQRAPGSPVPVKLPLFAEALGPEEWIAFNNIPIEYGKIDEDAAMAAFTAQLGDRWAGPNALKPYQQILLAAFALKSVRKRPEADAFLGRLARCWSAEKLDLSRDRKLLSEARGILRDKDTSGKILAMTNRHAFVTTAMLRALHFARSEGGVMAPAQFVWLRGYDRALWYPLNNLGRQSFHMEAMGAMSHFKAERVTQRPIPVPKVGDAIKTIKEYMASSRARPVPPLDRSKKSANK